ncbi:hypothetical protein BN8_04690 [Fibrisoma limi BUZ 3]|uniref:Uncharacterized protein n=1 Tax=Fibrisoma limi BUZ 3 TaxID=1185876 RepID=I2GNF3_9BACT|nr:hypothetical protein [Fibrisoma limi]CCH55431.1 hypothetical protein BN8_04690 [Fibrisoma limi BUZ 3]
MKHSLRSQLNYWLLASMCILSTYSYGQYTPFKGANMILLGTSLADKEALTEIANVLTDQSISFSVDRNLVSFQAKDKSSGGNEPIVFEGFLSVNAGLVKLTGKMQNAASGSQTVSYIPVEYTTSKASSQRLGFLYMDQLAKKLQPVLHGVIIYKYQ